MDQFLYIKGIFLILSAVLIFRVSFVYFKANQPLKSLFYIILGGTLLRLWCLSDNFLHAWDERYHALVAKNLIAHPLVPLLYEQPLLPYDYRQWTINHVWLHKQPLSLWFMSFSINLFGNVEWAVRLPSLLLSVACIYLTYLIARFFTNEKTALLASFFQSINGFVIELAAGRQSTDHIDTAFLFFIELSIWLTIVYVKKRKIIYLLGIGLTMGLAFLTKYIFALITIPIFFILTFRANQWVKTLLHSLLILVVALIVYLPWQVYIYTVFPQEVNWENQQNLLHLTEALEGHSGSVFWQLAYAAKIWNELIYLVFVWFIYFVSKRFNDKKLLSLTIWLIIPYLFFSFVATKMIAYPLFTAPAVFIIEALFCWQLLEKPLHFGFRISDFGFKQVVDYHDISRSDILTSDKFIQLSWLNKLLVSAVIILAARYCYERVKPFEDASQDSAVATTIKNWQPVFSKNKKNVVFNADNYIECMFYHNNCIAYPNMPQIKDIEYVQSLGYSVYIAHNSKIDTAQFANLSIQYLKMDAVETH